MYEFQTEKFLSQVWKYLNQNMFYHVEKSQQHFNEFQVCNAYLLSRSISDQKTLFINAYHDGIINSLIAPFCLVLLDKLLVGNHSRLDPTRLDDYMIYANGKMMKINYDARMGKLVLCYKDKRGNHLTPIHDIDKIISECIIINNKYFVARNFSVNPYNRYIDFFQHSFKSNTYPPFEHYYKAIMVCPKNSVREEIERYSLKSSFPYAHISTSTAYEEDYSIKADPLLYFCPNYDAAMRFVEENTLANRIKYVVVMQDHNVKSNIVNIKQDLAQKRYQHLVAISEEEVTVPEGSLHWHWASNDVTYLTGNTLAHIESISFFDDVEFDSACEVIAEMIKELKEEYNGTSSFNAMLFLYLNMLRNKLGIRQDISGEIETALAKTKELLDFEGYDDNEIDKDIIKLRNAFLDLTKYTKTIDNYLDANFSDVTSIVSLVVPHKLIDDWQEAVLLKGLNEIQLIPDNQLLKVLGTIDRPQEFYFTFIPTYKTLDNLLSYPLKASVNLFFSLSNAEISILNRYLSIIRSNLSCKRKYIPEWYSNDVPVQPTQTTLSGNTFFSLSQLIDDSYFEDDYQSICFTGESGSKQYNISVADEKGKEQNLKLAGTTSVIRVNVDKKEPCQVAELVAGEAFRLYSNPSKASLYEILTSVSDVFMQIEIFSDLWKRKLRYYVKDASDEENGNQLESYRRIINLAALLGINPDYIDKVWLSREKIVKFPQRKSLIMLLDILLSESIITDQERSGILSASRTFSSIMIKLGHNLSAEIHRVVLSTSEDDIQAYISQEVFNREDQYLCLSQFDEKAILAIIRRNTPMYLILDIKEEK